MIIVRNTNYSGEFLENILTLATTKNEMVERGLVRIIPGIEKKVSVPRMKMTNVMQESNTNPSLDDGQGEAIYSEKELNPHDALAFFPFLPSTFETVWRPYQPKGELIFEQLPEQVQSKLIEMFLAQFNQELGNAYINDFVGPKSGKIIFQGLISRMAEDDNVIVTSTTETTMLGKLKAIRRSIPPTIISNPNLRLLMSVEDFMQYDDELTQREDKNSDETSVNKRMYKSIKIEDLVYWPTGLIVATLCGPDENSNLYAAVNLQDDEHAIQVDKFAAASDWWFMKMKVKVDTNIAFGEEVVVLDSRTKKQFEVKEESISTDKSTLTFPSTGGTQSVKVTATGDWSHAAAPKGYTVEETEDGISVTASPNDGTSDVTGKIIITLDGDKTKTATLTLTTSKKA